MKPHIVPWYAVHAATWLKETDELNCEEFGALMRIALHQMATERPVSADENSLRFRWRLKSNGKVRSLLEALRQHLEITEDGLSYRRAAEAIVQTKQRRDAGEAGADARWGKSKKGGEDREPKSEKSAEVCEKKTVQQSDFFQGKQANDRCDGIATADTRAGANNYKDKEKDSPSLLPRDQVNGLVRTTTLAVQPETAKGLGSESARVPPDCPNEPEPPTTPARASAALRQSELANKRL